MDTFLVDEAPAPTAWVCRPEVAAITDWLVEQGLMRTGFDQLVEGFCHRLRAIDVPVWRAFVSADTLHPRIRGMGCSWREDQGLRSDVYIHRLNPPEAYLQSPFKRMLDRGLNELRVRLDGSEPIEFPLLEELHDQGVTDYLAQRTWFGIDGANDRRTGVLSSWATTGRRASRSATSRFSAI